MRDIYRIIATKFHTDPTLTVSVGLGLLILLVIWYRHTYGEKRTLLKDGSVLVRLAGVPLLGYALELSADTVLQDFQRMFGMFGPFIEYYIGPRKIMVISDVEAIKEILLARPKIFRREVILDHSANHAKIQKGLFFTNGNNWAIARKFTAPSFNKVNVNSHTQSILKLAKEWTSQLKQRYTTSKAGSPGNVFEFKEEALLYTLSVINKVAFGIDSTLLDGTNGLDKASYFNSKRFPQDLQIYFTYIVKTILFPFPISWFEYSPFHGKWQKDTHEATVRLDNAAMAVIERRRQELQQGHRTFDSTLLDTLFRKQEQDAMTDEDLLHNVKVVYLAGSETTSIAISYAVYFLSQHRDILLNVREEAKEVFNNDMDAEAFDTEKLLSKLVYTEAVVKEVIRLCSPASVTSVELEKGVDSFTLSNGLVITKDCAIVTFFDAVHYNEKHYEDASSFIPARWLDNDPQKRARYETNLLAFGYGPRVCPGQRLAMLEAILAVAALAYDFDMKLACDPKEIRRVLMFTSVPDKMPVILTPV